MSASPPRSSPSPATTSLEPSFARFLFAYLLPALVAKAGMVLVDLRDAAQVEWTVQLLGRAALFLWGRELWVALGLAGLAWLWTQAFAGSSAKRRAWAQLGVDISVWVHAVFCALAFAYFHEEGDFVTCALVDLVDAQGDHEGVLASLWGSIGPAAVFVLAASLFAAAWGQGCLARGWPRLGSGWRRALVALFVFEAVVSATLVPALVRGELPLRFKSHGLERTPLLRLASSCLEAQIEDAHGRAHAHARRPDFRWPAAELPPRPAWEVEPRPTHVVVLLLESVMDPVAFDQLESMPYTHALIDAPDTLHLDTHYSTWSLTSQATYSLLSGEYSDPDYAAVVGRKPGLELETLPERLRRAGYATWFYSSQDLAFDRQHKFYARHGFDEILDAPRLAREGIGSTGWGVDDRETLRRAFARIDAHREGHASQPFFMLVQTTSAHHPYTLPDDADVPDLALDAQRPDKYARAIRFLDHRVKELIEGLRSRGLLEDTLVLIVSDHGEGWGEYKGRNVAEPNIRPLALLRAPQLLGPEGEVRLDPAQLGPTSHVDLAPTVLGLLGLDAPCTMLGRDLSAGGQPEMLFFAGRPPRSQIGLRDGRWRFVLEDGRAELYDLERDPDSRENLAAQMPAKAARYRHLLEDWSVHTRWRSEHARQVRAHCAN